MSRIRYAKEQRRRTVDDTGELFAGVIDRSPGPGVAGIDLERGRWLRRKAIPTGVKPSALLRILLDALNSRAQSS